MLDPLAGSGVTLVEGLLSARNVIGVDIDPLAVRLCLAKTIMYSPAQVETAGYRVLESAQRLTQQDALSTFRRSIDARTLQFIDYWFQPQTQRELAALAQAIRNEQDSRLKTLLEVIFSSIIVTKSGGVSTALDLAHSRPHRVDGKTPGSALQRFGAALRRAIAAVGSGRSAPGVEATVLMGDCRWLPLEDDSIDLIVTSPPYANALDYMRAHKFSLCWLGYPAKALATHRSQYIGAERWTDAEGAPTPADVAATVGLVAQKDPQRGRVLQRYFRDMGLAIREMCRVLRSGRAAAIVIGPSTVRGIAVPTHQHLAAIGEQAGFEVVGTARRNLNRDRRMMPASAQGNGRSAIERRMHEEYVVGLVKR